MERIEVKVEVDESEEASERLQASLENGERMRAAGVAGMGEIDPLDRDDDDWSQGYNSQYQPHQ
jgi:hypothetical protein